MAKRYYISPIVGDGSETNPYRAKVSDHGKPWVGSIPTDATGKPTKDWALVLVDTVNHNTIVKDRTIDNLPDVSLDVKMSAIGSAEKGKMASALAGRGISDATNSSDSYRTLLNGIGRQLDPDFTVDNFDVG